MDKLTDNDAAEQDASEQTDPNDRSVLPASFEVELQRRFNEFRQELLTKRAAYIDRWLSAIAIVLTFFGIVVVVAGYLGYQRFWEIENRANKSVEKAERYGEEAKRSAEEAKRLVKETREHRDVAEKEAQKARKVTAKIVADFPEKAKQAVANIRKNPKASLLDKAIVRAISLQQQGKRDEAIEKWRAIANVAEGNDDDQAGRAWFSIGYLRQNPEAKIVAYDKAIRLKPDLAEAYNNRGIVKADLKQYKEAIVDYNEAIRLKPDLAEAYSNRGIVKADLKQYKEAIVDYNEAIRLKPDLAKAHNNRGNAKNNLRQYKEAIVDYNEAIRLKSDYAEAHNNRGNAKNNLKQYKEAIVDYNEAIRLKPDLAEAHNNRGNAKNNLRQYKEAIVDCNEAIRLKSDYAEAYFNRGNAKNNLKQYKEAIVDYNEAIRLKPDLAEAYSNRGMAKKALGSRRKHGQTSKLRSNWHGNRTIQRS